MPRTQLTRLQWLIAVAHVALALIYGAINPPWEAHDETGHFAYVNHLVATRSLPDVFAADKALFDQSHQPPLYYLVAAALTFWADRSDDVQPEFNHFALDGTNRRGFRIMLRQPEEAFPWHGTILALHATRAISALLTGLTVCLIASSANLIFGAGSTAALLSTALAAFNPQVIFMGAMVNNDAMVAAMGAGVAHHILRIAHGASRSPSPARSETPSASRETQQAERNPQHATFDADALRLGLALGLAFLSKNSALALIGFAALALAFIAWRAAWPARHLLRRGALVFGAFAVIALPYLGYNLARYGRLLTDRNPDNPILVAPTSVIGEGVWVSIRDAWLPQLFANTFRTFWGKFGWGNVGLPEWAYLAFAVLTLVGAVGCAIGYRRAERAMRAAIVVLLMLGLSMMALPLYRALFYQDPALMPGRYLMPALTSYACLLGFGWSVLCERWASASRKLPYGIAACLATFALIVPFAYIQPRYRPGLIAPSDANALLTFGDLVQLVDATAQTALLPDREGMRHYARVKLTWRALRPTVGHHAFSVSVLGRDNEVLGSIVAFPNLGNYPSTNWRAGDTFVDAYDILLEKPCPRLPALGKLHVTVFPFEPLTAPRPVSVTEVLSSTDGAGRPVAPIVGRFKIGTAPPLPVFWQPPLARFDSIWLREAQLPAKARPGETIAVTLTYEVMQPTPKRGTAFVHVLDASGRLVGQDDHAPLNGEYLTDLWDAGECVRETFRLTLPMDAQGALRIATGFYTADGARFKTGTPDDVAFIGEVRVEE